MSRYTVIGSYTIPDIQKMVAFEAEVGDGEYSPKTEVIKFLLNENARYNAALRLAVSDAYRDNFALTGMEPECVRYGFVSKSEYLDLRVQELIADAVKAQP